MEYDRNVLNRSDDSNVSSAVPPAVPPKVPKPKQNIPPNPSTPPNLNPVAPVPNANVQVSPSSALPDSDGMPPIVTTTDAGTLTKSRQSGGQDRQPQNASSLKISIVVGVLVVVAVAGLGWYFSGLGNSSSGSGAIPPVTEANRIFCYLVLREDVPRQLDLSNTQKMQHALATQAMSGKLNYIIGGIPNAQLLPVDTEALMNRADERRKKLDELGASLKRMLTASQQAKFLKLRRSLGLAPIEFKQDGKQFSVHFTMEASQANGGKYKSLDTQAAWSHLRCYSDVLELVERCQATTQELERDTVDSVISWLMQPYDGIETTETRNALAEAFWKHYNDSESKISQEHITAGLSRVGCGEKHVEDWMKATKAHNVRRERVVGGLCHFDLEAAGQYILDDARKDVIDVWTVEAFMMAGQPAVDIIVEANLITNGRHYGRYKGFVEDRGLDSSKLVSREELMADPVKGKEINKNIAAQQANARLENYRRALDALAKIEDVYAPPRASFSLIREYESFAPLVAQHGSPAPLLVKYIESDPTADRLARAGEALSYYGSEKHISTFKEVMERPESFRVARAWAAAALAVLSPDDFHAVTKNGFASKSEIAHFREACVDLNRVSVVVLAPLLKTSNLEQAIQVSHIIAKLDQPESRKILTFAAADPSWTDSEAGSFRATIEQRLRELTAQ